MRHAGPARRRGARSLRRALVALGLGLLLVLPGVVAAASVPPASDELVVEITDIAPAVLRPGDDLTVRGTVANPSDADVPAAELRLRMQYATPISRSMLDRWLDPASGSATHLLAGEDVGVVPAGASRTFAVTLPADELPLGESAAAWGPRGIEVEVTDGDRRAGTDRSFAVWYPDVPVDPTTISVLVPVVPTAGELAQDRDVASASAPRLTALVEAVDRPGISLAVDPLVLTAPAPDPGEQEETDPETPARAWSRLLSTVDGFRGEVVVLPWADADAAALADADRVDVLTDARRRAEDVAEDLGSVRDDVVWPVGDGTDQETVAAAAESGAAAVVLPDSHLRPAEVLTYTPSGRTELITPAGPVQAALADERLSAVLQGRGQAVNADPDEELTELDDLTARQLLLADTAVIARERPAEARSLLLALPRETEGRPSTVGLAERLDVLQDAPWIELSPLSDLLDLDVPAVSYAALPAALPPAPEAVGSDTLRTIASTLADVEDFASATEEPEVFLRRYTRTLGPAVATIWRQAPGARDTLVRELAAEVADLDEQVVVEPSSELLLINDVTHIPVRVSSSLPERVHVDVVLDGPDQRLEATDTVRVTVPAEGQSTAQVPVQAVGSGTALVEVALRTPSGEPVGTPTEITVRVRADWEDVGTAVVAGVLVIMLVVGLVRTARRGRRMRGETGGTA